MSTFNDICYKQIIDSFWYGLYGDFNLIIDRDTGCFNATKLCQKGGKQFKHWNRNKRTAELIEYMEKKIPNTQMMYTIEGNKNETYNTIVSGTYVREEFILDIASWISRDFYHKAHQIVISYYANEYCEKYKDKIEELNCRLKEIEQINQKYQDVEEDISPKCLNRSKRNIFILLDKCMPNAYYPYTVKRIQFGSKIKILKDMKKKYPNLNIVHEIDYSPNSINLFNLAKENIKDISVRGNDVKLHTNYLIDQFISDLRILSLKKF